MLAEPFRVQPGTSACSAAQGFKRRKRLLLVEDNALNREIAVEILKEVAFMVDTAEDGEKRSKR